MTRVCVCVQAAEFTLKYTPEVKEEQSTDRFSLLTSEKLQDPC